MAGRWPPQLRGYASCLVFRFVVIALLLASYIPANYPQCTGAYHPRQQHADTQPRNTPPGSTEYLPPPTVQHTDTALFSKQHPTTTQSSRSTRTPTWSSKDASTRSNRRMRISLSWTMTRESGKRGTARGQESAGEEVCRLDREYRDGYVPLSFISLFFVIFTPYPDTA